MPEPDATDVHGSPYWRDQAPFREAHPLDEYPQVKPLWILPDTIRQAVSLGIFPRQGVADVIPDHRINIWTQLLMAKQHIRKYRTFSPIGHICWVEFTAIEPCWMLLDNDDDYRLLTVEEYGQPRPERGR